MEQIYKEVSQQVLKQRKQGAKSREMSNMSPQLIEVQFRLGHICIYNQQSQPKAFMIQPLYYQLPNKKVVKHHQFRAHLEEADFTALVEHLKTQFQQFEEHVQIDYIYPDESKITVENIQNTREVVKSVKKQPLIQDIDITTGSQYDTRFSCKSVANIEVNINTMQPQTQRTKTLIIFRPIYYSSSNSVEIVCSTVQRVNGNIKQDSYEVEVKSHILATHQDSDALSIIKDLFSTLDQLIDLTV